MIKPEIIHEDNHLIVTIKPPGILSQGDISGEDSMLDIIREYIRIRYSKPGNVFTGLVHRLDRPVSGLMVFAKTSKGAARLHKEFLNKNVDKYYTALVEGPDKINKKWVKIKSHLVRIKDITVVSEGKKKNSQEAVMNYISLFRDGRYSLILIKLETGRKHQIRAQLSAAGFPILGDRKYGSKTSMGDSICLNAARLSFTHPTTREALRFSSPMPERFKKFITIEENYYQSLIDSAIAGL